MYRNVAPCYCNSGLSLEVSLSLQCSLITGLTVYVSFTQYRYLPLYKINVEHRVNILVV